jgi:hypothetical protein
MLLRAIVTNAPLGDNTSSLLDCEQAESAGRLCFMQLVELRHRGAFSTVAQTFAACCRRFSTAEEEGLKRLPDIWYQVRLTCDAAE